MRSYLSRLSSRERQSLTRLPDGEDEQLRSDEDHDEPLDELRQVASELGREDVRTEIARRGSDPERSEEQRGEEDPDSRVAPEQRNGDAEEGDIRVVVHRREV